MKKRIKNAIMELYHFSRWLLSFLHSKMKKNYNVKISKDVLIIGNGLSAKDIPFSTLSGRYDFCCVNHFATKNDDFLNIKPKYYVLIDPEFFKSKEENNKLFELFERVDWGMYLITYNNISFPVRNKKIKQIGLNRNYYGGNINNFKNFLYNKNMASMGYENVIVAALFFFIMNKASNIFLAGVEFDWHKDFIVDKNNIVYLEDNHFYGKKLKRYGNKQGLYKEGDFYKCIHEYYASLCQYRSISFFAKKNGVKVYNTTINSYIDVFDKIEIEMLI